MKDTSTRQRIRELARDIERAEKERDRLAKVDPKLVLAEALHALLCQPCGQERDTCRARGSWEAARPALAPWLMLAEALRARLKPGEDRFALVELLRDAQQQSARVS